jgi:hypothetical protein
MPMGHQAGRALRSKAAGILERDELTTQCGFGATPRVGERPRSKRAEHGLASRALGRANT